MVILDLIITCLCRNKNLCFLCWWEQLTPVKEWGRQIFLPALSLEVPVYLNRVKFLAYFMYLPGQITYSIQCQRHLETTNYSGGPERNCLKLPHFKNRRVSNLWQSVLPKASYSIKYSEDFWLVFSLKSNQLSSPQSWNTPPNSSKCDLTNDHNADFWI